MRIESLGLPGAGKSTIATAARAALADMGCNSVDPPELDVLDAANPPGHRRIWREDKERQSFHTARYLQNHIAFHFLCNRLYGKTTRNLGLLLSVGADWSRHSLNEDRYQSFWVDEGFLHLGAHALMVASNWNAERCQDDLAELIAAVPHPDAILLVEAPLATAIHGIFRRMPGRTQKQAERRFKNSFGGEHGMAERQLVIEQIAKAMEKAGVPVITAKGHSDIETVAQQVARQVRDIAARQPVPA